MTKTESATNFKESRGWCDPGKGLQHSHHFRAEGPNQVGALRDCCVNAYGLMEPEWHRKMQFEWYRGYCLFKTRLKEI